MSSKFLPSRLFVAFSAAAVLSGCASGPIMTGVQSPLKGGQKNNAGLFVDSTKAESCLKDVAACVSKDRIPVGTEKERVFETLGMQPKAFSKLTKQNLQIEIYGNTLYVPFEKREEAQQFMNSLEGLTATFSDLVSNRRFGLTSAQLETKGISVTFNIVLKDGKLFNPVNAVVTPVSESKTTGYLNAFEGLPGLFRR